MDYSQTTPFQDSFSAAETAASNPAVYRYDFKESARLQETEIEKFKRLNDRFSGDLGETLSALARRQMTVESSSVEQVKASAIGAESPDFSLRFLLDIEPLNRLDLEVNPGKRVAHDIRRIRRTGKLLTAPRHVAIHAQFIAPLPLAACTFCPGIHALSFPGPRLRVTAVATSARTTSGR